MTNNSIFTRVLSLVLCLVMIAGVMTSCYQGSEHIQNHNHGTQNGEVVVLPSNKPSTEDDAEKDPNEIFSASAKLEAGSLIYGSLAKGLFIGGDMMSAMLPVDVKIEDGATEVALSVKKAEVGDEIALDDGVVATSLDVHIDGIAKNNTVPMMVNLGAILEAGLDVTELKLYHHENGVAALMTRVNSIEEFAIHNQYYYNAETGEVTIYVASFSVFSAVKTKADEWDGTIAEDFASGTGTEEDPYIIDTAEQLAYFRAQVDAGNTFEGEFVKLVVDIDLQNKPFDPIGFGYWYEKNVVDGVDTNTVFMGTFDGGNHTIYNLYQNCWELDPDKTSYSTYTYSTAGAGLFASIKNATVKNLAISGAEIVFECVDMGIVVGYAQGTCHFENIVVTDSKIANYNRYTGGVVGEVSYGPYGIDTSLGYSHTFKNITVDSSVTVSGLWGSFGCGMGGVIGGKWSDATVYMENVVSAPTMDVYNDVVSAYQWYAFRGCGMLIGHTEEPYSDGRHSGNATASFLTCENVNVYYGDWINYNYYEFADQDNATGRNYPWVRAEAGEYCDAFSNIRYGVPTHGGVKVSDLSEEELKAVATNYTTIVFNQLYGADRGMYGTNEHEGVTIYNKLTKTIYVQNNLGWENLKLYYWYLNGDERWTTVPEGITLTEENGVYKVDLPAYAHGYQIIADGENATREFYLSEVEENGTYTLDFEHVHNFNPTACDCGAVRQLLEHEFTLGEDGEEKHNDGGNAVTTYEENGFTLTLENISNVYGKASDARGNSCIKLGTGSLTGGFSFTVSAEVEKVIIYVAGYKNNNATIEINRVQHEITTLSNNGEYTAIEVDTSETKTVSITTIEVKSEPRCMINTIVFVTSRVVEVHECDENEEIPAVDPTCTEIGLTAGKACSVCGKVMVEQNEVAAIGHTEETLAAVEVTCTKNGLTEGKKCSVCKEILVAQETIPSTGHNYVGGTCENCGAAFPTTAGTYTYVFANYTEGEQYAKGEEHKLDENVTITTYDCHFTDELRIYSSSTNNGYAIIYSDNPISKIGVNAGNKEDTINIYGSNDGTNWTEEPIATISVTSTSYKDYTVELQGEYKYIKLDVAGGNQVRIKSMTLTTVPDCAHASTTEKVVAPTCTEAGYTKIVCSSCGKVMSTVEGDPATGHLNQTTTTVNATCTTAGSITVTCDDCDAVISTETIPTIDHADANTDNDHNCDVCGAENVTEHVYVDGTCDCGATEPTEPEHTCESVCGTCGGCTDASCGEIACANKCQGHSATPTWTLVTNVTELQVGDQIIIVAKDYAYALSKTQNGNNRGQASVTKDGNTVTFGDDVQIIVLEAGTTSGTFAFYTGSGYLYAASSSSNYLKTQTTNNANGSWKITIAADGTSTIVAQGTNSRNTMQYNQSSSLFACYASASQKAIVIYKLEGGETSCEHTNTTTTTVDATCTVAGSVTVTCDDCGKTVSTTVLEAIGHSYEDGTCSVCGEEDPNSNEGGDEGETKEVTITNSAKDIMGLAGLATTNGTGVNNKEIALDNNISVIFSQGKAGTAPAYYDPAIRLYQNGATLTVKGTGMKTIVITVNSTSGDGPISVSGGTASDLTSMKYTITVNEGANEVVITTTGTDKNSRVYVSDIEVVYEQ